MRTKRENTKLTLLRRVLTCLVSAAMVVAFTPVVAWGTTATGVEYLDENGVEQTCNSATVLTSYDNNWGDLPFHSSWYVVNGEVIINSRAIVTGNVHLILTDGCTLTVIGGIQVQDDDTDPSNNCANTLTIYAQSTGRDTMGKLISNSTDNLNAGIGGNAYTNGSITINGGMIEASGTGGAGIGGGSGGNGTGINITINGGYVSATSDGGAGIGGGGGGNAGAYITVSGGVVTAIGGSGCPGIGGSRDMDSHYFSTGENGNAVVFTSRIGDKDNQTSWRGVIFEGASYNATNGVTFEGVDPATFGISQSFGENSTATVNIGNDLTLSNGHSITVGSNAEVIVANLTNNGTITNNGKIYVDGLLTGTAPANGTNGAVYYPLTLNADGGTISGGSGIAELNGNKYYNSTSGTTLPILTKNGYTFAGWTGTNQSTPSTSVTIPNGSTGNKSYTANWTINQYTITFDTDGGNEIAPITQDYATAVTAPENPTKTGYRFDRWSEAVPATMPAENKILTAQWQINQYKVTFEPNGGSAVVAISDDFGKKVTEPKPTKEGYTFAGWYSDAACFDPNKVDFNSFTIPAENITLYAKWNVNQYTIAFESNGGTAVGSITQDYGTAVTLPTNVTKTGYTFAGWYSDSGLSTQYTESNMPAGNITLYAKWLSQDASVKTVTVKGVGATVDNASRTVEVTLPYNVALPTQDSDFVIVPAQGATVTTPPVKEGDVWKFTVTAEDGKTKATYTISVNVQKENVPKENVWKETVLRLQSTASKTSVKLKWNAVPEADGYVIYWGKCGFKSSFKQVKVVESGKTLTWTHKNLKKGSWNRYYVKAYKVVDGKKSFIKTSNKIHLVTKGGKYTNVKKLKASASSMTLKKGKTKSLKIKQTYAEKNKKPTLHMRPLTYITSDKTVATVTSKGVIKAKGTGSCYIYITAYSGVYTRVKVTVK